MYKNYLLVAVRNLIKQKALNLLNVLGLAVGIAAGLIIAIHIRGEMRYDTSYADANNIYRIHRDGWATSSPPLAREFKDFFPEVEMIGRFAPFGVRVVRTDRGVLGEATGYYADSSVFKMFGFRVTHGDVSSLGAVNSAVITQQMAAHYFKGESAVGQVLHFDDGRALTVTAVMEDPPRNSHLTFDFLVSMPSLYQSHQDADRSRDWMIMYTYAKIRAEGRDRVFARMPQFTRKYYSDDPDVDQKVQSKRWRLMPLTDIHLRSSLEKEMHANSNILYIYVLLAVELLILIVASANFMSLFTTQALRRVKEVGMRKVLGAQPRQLIIQYLTEVSLLILVACVLAFLLYQVALPYYSALTRNAPGRMEIFSKENIAIICAMLTAVILISGLYPAIFISRFTPGSFLRESKLPNSMPNLVRNGLLVFQFFVSVSLIAAALIIRQQMNMMKNKDLGFDKEQVVTVRLYGDLWQEAFNDTDAFKAEFLKNPDILTVGRVDKLIGERLTVESVTPEPADQQDIPDVRVLRVDEDYVEAMNIRVTEGRNFSRLFNDSAAFIINESAVKTFNLAHPINAKLVNHSNARAGRIVGVVKDYHFATLHAPIEPLVIEYKPRWTRHLVFRLRAGKAREALSFIRTTVDRLSPHTLFVYQFLDSHIDALYRSEDVMRKVFQFFSVLAVIISCMGLFGLASYTIERRMKEIGIRKVLGASVPGLVSLVSSRVLRLIMIGFGIAVPVTWYVMQKWLNNFAYKIEIEWWIFALTGLIIIAVACLAIGFRAINAALINPVHALRNE